MLACQPKIAHREILSHGHVRLGRNHHASPRRVRENVVAEYDGASGAPIFANGALSGAFEFAFNYCVHGGCSSKIEQFFYDWAPGYKFATGIRNSIDAGGWDFETSEAAEPAAVIAGGMAGKGISIALSKAGSTATTTLAETVTQEAETPLLYHYTTAPESSFSGGLYSESSVTDKIYANPFQASQELGIPVPDKVIPILNKGQFIPNKPSIVQPSNRYMGGGTDFTNPARVPAQDMLPARPVGGG